MTMAASHVPMPPSSIVVDDDTPDPRTSAVVTTAAAAAGPNGSYVDDDASCRCCRAQRALLHCAQHAARLCLPCDVLVHSSAPAHERELLCDGCHAAPAAAHCGQHRAVLCAPCAGAARCAAEQHCRRPVRAFTGFPKPDDLARILSGSEPAAALPEEPPGDDDTGWLPCPVSLELAVSSGTGWGDLMAGEPPSDGLNEEAGDGDDGEELRLLQQQHEWPNINVDQDMAIIGHVVVERVLEASSSSRGHELSPCPETIMEPPSLQPSVTNNTAAACEFSSFPTINDNANLCTGVLLTAGPPAVSSSMQGHDQYLEPSPEEKEREERRTKQRANRQRARQRYNEKKRNMRFDRKIMYDSRKSRADTRNRVKGRFAKKPSNSDHV